MRSLWKTLRMPAANKLPESCSEAICKTRPCKQHLRIHNLCIDDPEEIVQCWLCSLHSAHSQCYSWKVSFRILESPTPSRLTTQASGRKIYNIGSTLSALMSRTIRKTLKPPLLVPLPEKTQATRQCKHKQTKLGIQLVGITSRKLNAELHKSP